MAMLEMQHNQWLSFQRFTDHQWIAMSTALVDMVVWRIARTAIHSLK
jgi:hypothetical protein